MTEKPAIDNNEIRHRILQILYNDAMKYPDHIGIDRDEMKRLLQIPENTMDFNIFYLSQQGLIEIQTTMGRPWLYAMITAFGTDVIEQKDRYAQDFPFVQTNIQQVFGDVSGQVTQVTGGQASFSQTIVDSFKTAHDIANTKKEISADVKREIEEKLRLLEEELKKKQAADAGKIQKLWDWIKTNASWLVPTLAQVVSECIKIIFG